MGGGGGGGGYSSEDQENRQNERIRKTRMGETLPKKRKGRDRPLKGAHVRRRGKTKKSVMTEGKKRITPNFGKEEKKGSGLGNRGQKEKRISQWRKNS